MSIPGKHRSTLKGAVSVISSEPPFKDCNARFTTVPLNPCLIKYEIDINVSDFVN